MKRKQRVFVLFAAGLAALASILLIGYTYLFGPHSLHRARLEEDFDDGLLDSSMSVKTVGSFKSAPGIKDSPDGSGTVFGFGKSTCGASCFGRYTTTLRIALPQGTHVSEISFREQEHGRNWGSDGSLLVDGEPVTPGQTIHGHPYFAHFGRQPRNDNNSDASWRVQHFRIDRNVRVVELRVTDITDQSEILIDNLEIR